MSEPAPPSAAETREFVIGETDFLLDGAPFRVLSGALHYFRVHPDHWRDRIVKARQMGLNTIETYIAWNEHSPTPDRFDTEGGLDFARFLAIVQEEGMFAIVRPGPYICAEWDNGGLPAWLFLDADVGIRRSEPRFLSMVDEYLARVYDVIAPLQVGAGGPVILVQIENEYGAYGDDASYLEHLTAVTRARGITVPLTTIDQPTDEMLSNGSIPVLHKTASFGSRATERLATLREHQPTGPLMCAEFWDGWFDHWGAHHHTTTVAESANDLDDLLSAGASVNVYMFHGGTNFGLTSGANDKGVFQPTVTSYDYDAPLDEAGNPTAKYFAFQAVLARHGADVGAPATKAAPDVFDLPLTDATPLFEVLDQLGDWTEHSAAPSLDSLGHYRGFAVYRAGIPDGGPESAVLSFGEVRDRAAVFVERRPVGTLYRDHHDESIALPGPLRPGDEISVLVEDQGRVNYGPRLGEDKGLIGEVLLGTAPLTRWSVLAIDLDRLVAVGSRQLASASTVVDTPIRRSEPVAGPSIAAATFRNTARADLFLDTSGWGKGVAWINGFCLGRYWRRGPQQTLFVPAPVLVDGVNELVVFELDAIAHPVARFVDGLRLGHTDF